MLKHVLIAWCVFTWVEAVYVLFRDRERIARVDRELSAEHPELPDRVKAACSIASFLLVITFAPLIKFLWLIQWIRRRLL